MKTFFDTVSGKLLLAAGLAISLILLSYTAYSGWQTSVRVQAQVMDLANHKLEGAASQVAQHITEATSAGAALGGMISGYLATGQAEPQTIIAMLEAVPGQYETLFSSWMAAVPGSGIETLLPGPEGRNEAGVFTPYWTKAAGGGLLFQTFPIKTEEMWYSVPVSTGRSLTTEPYLTPENYLLTSVAVPVRVKEEIVAIVGVDITLEALTTMLAEIETFEGGRMMLLDSAGKWVANPDPARLTQAYDETGKAEVRAALSDGGPRVIAGLETGATRLVYPFTTPAMNATWAVVLDVPQAVFTAPVRREVLANSLGGGLILLMALVTIYLSSTRLVRQPLAQMLAAVNALAAGRYDTAVPGAARRDEMGAMAGSVDLLRRKLIERQALEGAQEQLRAEAEAEREKRAAEDAQMRAEREARLLADQERERREALAATEARAQEEAERAEREAEQAQVVSRLAAGLRGLAEGALDVSINTRFVGSYDQLRLDFNDTVARLADLLGAIDGATQSIVGGVAEITGATTDLSRRAETSAGTLEETAAALNELTAAVQSAAQSARRADAVVKSATEKARSTTVVVEEAVTAMGAIQSSSAQISKIINVIDDIAFQTNLLALNAGVEAARAGEAGRGFAVVASEVRALAQRASEAAREINALISSSGEQVTTGVDLVGRAGEALQSIVEAVEAISSHVGAIAGSADEQASGIGEINAAVNQLDRTQQHNAAAYEETAATCLALSDQARGLADLVGQFRITSARNGPAARSATA